MIRAVHVKRNFIEQSLMSAVSFIKDATLCEEHASHKGFLQSLDARIKTITFFVFLLTAVFLKSRLVDKLVVCLLFDIGGNVTDPIRILFAKDMGVYSFVFFLYCHTGFV